MSKAFWYYIRDGSSWEDYQLRTVIEAETITVADDVFQHETGLNPKGRGISVTLEPLP